MKKVINRSYAIFLLVGAFFVMLAILGARYWMHGAAWATNSLNNHIFSYGALTNAGPVTDCNGVILASTEDGKRKYNDSFSTRVSTLHIVGDKAGIISSGVQTLYRSSLVGYDRVNGLFKTINKNEGGLKLTIDSAVNAAAYQALGGAKGAVMVYNYKTGEIPCMVSAPSFDPVNPPSQSTLNNDSRYEGVYINRCFNGLFTPGSTMKIITTICALENLPEIENETFNCTGSTTIGGDVITCSGVHGKQTLEKALNHSCNVAFAEIAVRLGGKKLSATMKELGMTSRLSAGKLKSSKCSFDYSKAADSDIGWAGVGQFNTLVTPVHMLTLVGTIANGGTYVEPNFIVGGKTSTTELLKLGEKVNIDPSIAAEMDKLLRSNVKNYYGDRAFPDLQMTGKTGSAERGKENGYKLRHCWYVGYSQRADFPYAVVVIMENLKSGSGFSTAVPVANKVLQKLLSQK